MFTALKVVRPSPPPLLAMVTLPAPAVPLKFVPPSEITPAKVAWLPACWIVLVPEPSSVNA